MTTSKLTNYLYDIQESSFDSRMYTITSNHKLPEEVVDELYRESDLIEGTITHLSEIAYDLLKDYGFKIKDYPNLNVTCHFSGVEYGDDCQVDITETVQEATSQKM